MSQTSYTLEQGVAVSGGLGDANPMTIDSYNNPVDEIKFGRMVAKVSGDEDGVELPSGASAVLLGVAVRTLATEADTYEADSAVSVIKKGKVFVEVEEAVTADDDVYVRHTSGTGSELGIFRTDADTASAVQLTNARWIKGAGANEVALLELY